MRSWIVPPWRSTAAARPRASLAGCTRAQCGVKRAPRSPATRTRAAASSTSSSSPRGAARRRASWGAVWATVSEPPLTKSQSMPSRAQAAPTSSTVSWAARSSAAIAASPAAARWREPVETSPSTQPPLRPEAPKPATSRSRTTTASDGSARSSS